MHVRISVSLISTVFLILLCFSCESENNTAAESIYTKLITSFDPSFDETSEITYLDSGQERELSILIKKDLFRNVSKDGLFDTLYYRVISLTNTEINLIRDTLLNTTDSTHEVKDVILTDGITTSFLKIQNKDTSFLIGRPYLSIDPTVYKASISILNTFQKIFNDSVVNSYFEIVRSYINGNLPEDNITKPYKSLREGKYTDQIRYMPQTKPTNY